MTAHIVSGPRIRCRSGSRRTPSTHLVRSGHAPLAEPAMSERSALDGGAARRESNRRRRGAPSPRRLGRLRRGYGEPAAVGALGGSPCAAPITGRGG
ncbi:MAG: hypothetical protein MZV70_08045 [Desulfobacterales bacterium]|nr:hypothetical protein [Desulfobacterales bacterium]